MKLLAFSLTLFAFIFVSCDETKKTETEKSNPTAEGEKTTEGKTDKTVELTSIRFEDTLYNFGKVNEGDPVVHVFKFKNTGENPLVISNAQASCGCTVPAFTKDPVAPGETGEIKVTFDSNNKNGTINKSVTVTANTPEKTILKITGSVLPKVDGPYNKK